MTKSATNNLIPAKFLVLFSHLIVSICLLWNVPASTGIYSPEEPTTEVIVTQKRQMIAGLSMTIAMIIFELLAFLTGVTMFETISTLLCIVCHCGACTVMFYLAFDNWQCGWFWWLFAFGSVLPAFTDLFLVCDVFITDKY